MDRIELSTSPLPRECSTSELHGLKVLTTLLFFAKISQTGAGEGNRTLVISLENFCSTIELHPQGAGRGCKAAKATTTTLHPQRPAHTKIWWWGKDSNLRRQSRQIYSLIPLTAREPLRTKPRIIDKNRRPVIPLQAKVVSQFGL